MVSVFLLHVGFEISLAFRNLVGFAQADPRVRDHVRFHLCERRVAEFTPAVHGNDFATFSEAERTLHEVARLAPDVLAVSCYIWNKPILLQFCERAKALCPGLLVVAGGPEVSFGAERAMRRWPALDVIVCGEGEETFRELLVALVEGRREELAGMPGTITRGEDGALLWGPRRAPLETLDAIPSPYEDELARGDPALRRFEGMLVYETVRGCANECAYCLYGRGVRRLRAYDVERAARDLSGILLAGFDVQIIDPIFGADRRRTKELLRRLAPLEYPGGLYLEVYAESLDEELVDLLVAARARQLGVGLQTTNPIALAAMGRSFHRERFEASVRLLAERGLPYYVDVIYGLPGDTYDDFLRSVDFALGLPDADVELYRLLVLPGARFHREASRHGLVASPEPPYEVYGCATFPYDDVLRAHRIAHTLRLLRSTYRRVQQLAPLWRRHYGGAPTAFVADVADYLVRRHAVDFFQGGEVEEVAYRMRLLLADFYETRGLVEAE